MFPVFNVSALRCLRVSNGLGLEVTWLPSNLLIWLGAVWFVCRSPEPDLRFPRLQVSQAIPFVGLW